MLNDHGLYEIGRTIVNQGKEYRLLSQMPRSIPEQEPEGQTYEATYVDFETTGLDTETAEITQFGWVRFQFDDAMKVTKIISTGLKHNIPKNEVEDDAARLTGLTKAKLEEIGERITKEDWKAAFEGVEFGIAHNAKYDRRFVDRYSELPPLIWCCTNADLDLRRKLMIPSNSLGVLMAYLKDWYFGHHDALEDSWAGVHLCTMYLKDLVAKAYTPQFNIVANNSIFESKDALKYAGYRWNNDSKVWYKANVDETDADKELEWLEQYCHGKQEKIPIDIKARHL